MNKKVQNTVTINKHSQKVTYNWQPKYKAVVNSKYTFRWELGAKVKPCIWEKKETLNKAGRCFLLLTVYGKYFGQTECIEETVGG